MIALQLRHLVIDGLQLGRRLGLGQHDPVQPWADHLRQVALAEFGIEGIDADIAKAVPRPFQGFDDGGPGGRLFGQGNGVFEVQDRRVGAGAEDLFRLARMVAGREQQRPEGTSGHDGIRSGAG